jgi:hypothetical protein
MHKSSHELMIGSCSNVGRMVAAERNGYFSGFHSVCDYWFRTLGFHQSCTVLVALLVVDGLL